MQFTTPIPIPKNSYPIDYSSKIVSLGSCFAENMGDKFQYFKFQSTINPFGIIFNPVSIERIIDRVVNEVLFTEDDVFFHNERWHCFEVHSDLSHSDKDKFLANLNQILTETKKQLQEVTHIIITYGTSWVYRNIEKNTIVANCHKVPQKQFAKELLTVATIQESIENTMCLIEKINPNCNFIFTVSPIRHLKDGFVENQRSKSHLITAIHNLLPIAIGTEICNLKSAIYFPSYEIMMDELRDYRFYAEDMIHPSQVAIDYIWEQFKKSTIAETAYDTMEIVESIQKSLEHRPFNPNSESHKKFESKLKEKITKLVAQYSFMKF
ncbi:GSCFA domain-containing protein [Flavobacterium taihuense]|uniref:GSCFA domain-containing protein n=1 Tax=Flavobacterium taihuense TaxID=2857508 RepID=A0ABS6XT24_9FLAO|nr:GSCFA domain-containing protein [Flavobacterium taihuense]MBW4359815.1 GSCFA domain-containing protein [Flavobacterium taihuense]